MMRGYRCLAVGTREVRGDAVLLEPERFSAAPLSRLHVMAAKKVFSSRPSSTCRITHRSPSSCVCERLPTSPSHPTVLRRWNPVAAQMLMLARLLFGQRTNVIVRKLRSRFCARTFTMSRHCVEASRTYMEGTV
jgi:hypothetical protein